MFLWQLTGKRKTGRFLQLPPLLASLARRMRLLPRPCWEGKGWAREALGCLGVTVLYDALNQGFDFFLSPRVMQKLSQSESSDI